MTDMDIGQFPTKELVTTFTRIADVSKGIISTAFNNLHIPYDLKIAESDKLKEKLQLLRSGNRQDIQKFVHELEIASQGAEDMLLGATAAGGVTKLDMHWWGCRLYISHKLLSESSDIGSLAAAISAICGPTGAAIAASLGITIALLKIIDRGNGIILTKYGWIAPIIPIPQ